MTGDDKYRWRFLSLALQEVPRAMWTPELRAAQARLGQDSPDATKDDFHILYSLVYRHQQVQQAEVAQGESLFRSWWKLLWTFRLTPR